MSSSSSDLKKIADFLELNQRIWHSEQEQAVDTAKTILAKAELLFEEDKERNRNQSYQFNVFDLFQVDEQWMRFWIGGQHHQGPKLKELITSSKYDPLVTVGLDISSHLGYDAFGKGERGQWQFGFALDFRFNHGEQLLWYAGNRPDDYVRQIAAKVDRVRKNPNLVQLMREFNEEVIGIQVNRRDTLPPELKCKSHQ